MPFFSMRNKPSLDTAASATVIAALLALGLTASHEANAAATVYDNLASSQDGSDPVLSYGPLADSFMTGANAAQVLSGIQAMLKNDGPDVVGSIHVGLHADSGNAPGAELVSLGDLSSAGIASAAFAPHDFTPIAPFTLAQNTKYWVQIDAVTPNAVSWSWSNDATALGVAGQSNHSATLGTSPNSSFGPYQMSVTVAAVPEPDGLILAAAGLGCVGASRLRRRGIGQ